MLIVVGSRREGNSYSLAKIIQKELEKERIYSEIIIPGNQTIFLCTGCMDCDKTGICDFDDDMKKNIELIKNENIIMFITPTRWNLLSGDLKIFMDRLNPLYSKKQLKNKKAIIVSIGSKSKEIYSTESSNSSLKSFIRAAEMDCILECEFNNCLVSNDIIKYEENIQKFIEDVKNVI